MNFKQWLEKTLYHGTVIDNKDSIQKHGLQGGWHGPIGGFVSNFYDDEDYGSPTEDDEVVFMTDKQNLGKAINAMTFHVGAKLKKDFHDVNDNDIRNHGLLVISKDGDSDATQYSSYKQFDNPPRGAEEGDYFAPSMSGDILLHGSALIRFLKRNNQWPLSWQDNASERERYYRGKLGAWAINRGHEKQPALDKIKAASMDDVQNQLKKWKTPAIDKI